MMHKLGRKQKKEVNSLVTLLDSTPIILKGLGFDKWTKANKNSRTQGLKLHIGYNPEPSITTFSKITPANVNDISIAQNMPLQENTTYVFDKGYCDYDWWFKIDKSNSFFVTRLKQNAAINVINPNIIDDEAKKIIIEDVIICLSNKNPRAGKRLQYIKPLRRITVSRADKDSPLILVTNDFKSDPLKIAELYKKRWLIELFF